MLTECNKSTRQCQLRNPQGFTGKKINGKIVSLRTETSYKAASADQLGQHSRVHGLAEKVNDEAVQLESTFLFGEFSIILHSIPVECVSGGNWK